MKNVQVIILIIFAIFIIVGVLVFADIIPTPKTAQEKQLEGRLTLWGTLPKDIMAEVIDKAVTDNYKGLTVTYVQRTPETFANSIIEALAAGVGPDLVILPDNLFIRFKSKIQPFTMEEFSERQFLDNYADGGSIFVVDQTVYALPVSIDPMVMYYNKDMLATAGISSMPKYWDEFLTLAPILTKRTETNEIIKSAVAFGEFRNVTNAKDIIATLIIQTGNPIIQSTPTGLVPTLSGIQDIPSAERSFQFFTDFADPAKPTYSWNRSLPESKSAFTSNNLAFYFGYASEIGDIRAKNPNLNFDVAQMPQIRDAARKLTFGKVSGIAVFKNSRQQPQAFLTAQLIASSAASELIAKSMDVSPANRSLLGVKQKDPFLQIFYSSALISKTWLDLEPAKTTVVFQKAIDSILSGQASVAGATSRLNGEFSLLVESVI